MGIVKGDISVFTLLIAKNKQFFAAEKLKNLRFKTYTNEDELLQACIRNEIDCGSCKLFPVLKTLIKKQLSAKILSPLSYNGYCLITKKEKQYIDFSDILKENFGILEKNGMGAFLLKALYKEYNIPLNFQKTIVLNFDEIEKKLLTGDITGVILPEPMSSQLLQNPKLILYMLSEKIIPNHVHSVLFIKSSLIKNRPDILKPILHSLFEASGWIERNKVMSKRLFRIYFPEHSKEIRTAMGRFLFSSKLQPPNVFFNYITFFKQQGLIKSGNHDFLKNPFMIKLYSTFQKDYIARKQKYYNSFKRRKEIDISKKKN